MQIIDTKKVQDLLKTDMTRKEFLQAVGAVMLSIVGITAFLKNMDKFAQLHTKGKVKDGRTGYGSSPYGR